MLKIMLSVAEDLHGKCCYECKNVTFYYFLAIKGDIAKIEVLFETFSFTILEAGGSWLRKTRAYFNAARHRGPYVGVVRENWFAILILFVCFFFNFSFCQVVL